MPKEIKHIVSSFLIAIILVQGFVVGIMPTNTTYAAAFPTTGNPTHDRIANYIVRTDQDEEGEEGGERAFWLCVHFDNTKIWLNGLLGRIVTQDFEALAPRVDRGDDGGGPDVVPVWENNHVLLNDIESMARVTEVMAYKDCVLDPVAHVLKSFLVDEITSDIIDWVQVGFEGGPTFLTNPLRYGKEASNLATDIFLGEVTSAGVTRAVTDIYDRGIEDYFCEPFAEDVVRDFTETVRQPDIHPVAQYANYGCTIEDDVYISLTDPTASVGPSYFSRAATLLHEGNNPINSTFNIRKIAADRIGQVMANESILASNSDGFMASRCNISESDEAYFTVCTPGSIVASQVDDWLGGSLGQLENAAKTGEILNEGYARIVERILIPNADDAEYGLLSGALRSNATAEDEESNNPFWYGDEWREYEQHDHALGGMSTDELDWHRDDDERFEDLRNIPIPPPGEAINPDPAVPPPGWVGTWPPPAPPAPPPAPAPAPPPPTGPDPGPDPYTPPTGPITPPPPPGPGTTPPTGWPPGVPWPPPSVDPGGTEPPWWPDDWDWPPESSDPSWSCSWALGPTGWYAQCCMWGFCIRVGS